MRITTLARTLLPLGAALALAGCGGAEEADEDPAEMTERPLDTQDLSGGELIAVDPAAEGVPVDLPETEMTNASQEEIDAAATAAATSAPPAQEGLGE